MKFLRQPPLLLKNTFFTLLLLTASITLYQWVAHHPTQWDVTQAKLNSLGESSVEVLKRLPGEVTITVYITEQDVKQSDMRRLIREFIAIYQRYKSDITLTFVDPIKEPEAMRKASIQNNGEMVVEYSGRNVHLSSLNEQTLSSALLGLAHSKDELLMYLDGHGERKLNGVANHDLGEFGKKLQQNGFRISSLNLTIAPDVPSNAGLLVLTHPQGQLLGGEVDKILRHLDNGGNLLWLIDAEPLRGLEPVAEKLGLLLSPGIIIDPAAQEMNAPANWTLSASYPIHPVTHNFNLITVFPYARSLAREENSAWQRHIIVEAAPRGWVSRTPLKQGSKPRFDKNHDIPGPFSLAVALQRTVNDIEQRIVVVGGASFLANAYSGNGGNMDLGINMVNWLTNEEALIITQPRANKDGMITFSSRALTVISVGLVIALPLLLLAVGGIIWWRRRN
ncbi:MAG: GldG family protein [Gallionellaceae bacterium]